MMVQPGAAPEGRSAANAGTAPEDDVVEISLLLPADRVEALVNWSRRSNQSVGQILRRLIDRALANDV